MQQLSEWASINVERLTKRRLATSLLENLGSWALEQKVRQVTAVTEVWSGAQENGAMPQIETHA